MTGRRPIPDRSPQHLYGKSRRDQTIRLYNKFVDGYIRASTLINRHDVVSKEGPEHSLVLVVRERRVEAHDDNVVSLVLASPDGSDLPPWRPGAHLDLQLPSGRRRQYSLCGDPENRSTYRIGVRRIPDGNGGSVEIHDTLPIGSTLEVKGPRNGFGFAVPGYGSPSKRLHFVAGGIGITPILPMARLAQQLDLDWSMTYTGRSRDSLPFLDEVESFGDRVTVRTDDAHGLPVAKDLLADVAEHTAVYCCGPTPLVSGLLEELRGAVDIEFHFERFSAPPVVDGVEFEVSLARTGEVVTVPADRTALDVIRERRPNIAYSCQQGFCRTCIVHVLEGQPEHRDNILLDEDRERGEMLVCVSRSNGGRLTLDI